MSSRSRVGFRGRVLAAGMSVGLAGALGTAMAIGDDAPTSATRADTPQTDATTVPPPTSATTSPTSSPGPTVATAPKTVTTTTTTTTVVPAPVTLPRIRTRGS